MDGDNYGGLTSRARSVSGFCFHSGLTVARPVCLPSHPLHTRLPVRAIFFITTSLKRPDSSHSVGIPGESSIRLVQKLSGPEAATAMTAEAMAAPSLAEAWCGNVAPAVTPLQRTLQDPAAGSLVLNLVSDMMSASVLAC